MLRANIDWKSAFLKGVDQFRPNFREEGKHPHEHIFARIDRPVNAIQHTKKLCSGLSSSEVHFLTEKDHFAFLRPLGGWRATYAVHLRLIEKRVVDFPLVVTELSSLGVKAEALQANIDWNHRFCSNRVSLAQIFRHTGAAPTNCSWCLQIRINVLSYGIKYQPKFLSFCHNSTFDRQTDRQTFRSWLRPPEPHLHWGGGYPLPDPISLGVYGASTPRLRRGLDAFGALVSSPRS